MKKTILTTTIAFLLGMGMGQNAHADLKDGLVAHWSFDDCRATDNSGNGHDGTLNGNPQCVDGVKGKAFSFDGVSDFIDMPYPKSLVGNPSFTVSFWMKYEPQSRRQWIMLFGKPGVSTSEHWLINSDSSVQFGLWGSAYSEPATQNYFNISDSQFKWVHVSTVWNSVLGELTTFIDGTKKVTTNPHDLPNIIQDTFGLGGFSGLVGDSSFLGKLDEARIYNRALTEAEVLELYNGKTELTYTPEPDPTPIIGKMPDPKLEASGVCSVTQTAAMQVGGNGMISSSSAAEVYDFGGNSSTTKTCTNVGLPADKPTDPFYELVNYVYEKKIDDAVAIIPTLFGYLVDKHPYFKSSMIIKGKSVISITRLTADIKKSLIGLQGIDIKAMGLDFVAGKVIDKFSASVTEQIGGSTGRYVGGAVWFALNQSWGVYKALGEAGGNTALIPLALLKAQSDLLITVIKKDIDEAVIAKKANDELIVSEINAAIVKGEVALSNAGYYQNYFILGSDCVSAVDCKKAVKQKSEIVKTMTEKQYDFLKSYLTGKEDTIFTSKKKIAIPMYNAWKKKLAGELAKREFAIRAELLGLVVKADEAKADGNEQRANEIYAEVERRAELFFGVDVTVSTGKIDVNTMKF